MGERCILFFDIDGTLIADDPGRYLPDSAKKAIDLARKAGHLAFINTGRVIINVDDFIRSLGFDGYVCGCGTYIEYRNQVLLHHRLPYDLCRRTSKLCYDCGLFALFESADSNGYDARMSERYAANTDVAGLISYFSSMGRPFMTDVTSPEFTFDKFSAWFDGGSDMERFRTCIEKDFTYIDRGAAFCEIVPKAFSKATGISYLMEYFGIPRENTYAFGDSANDLPMLTFVNHSVVMDTAPWEVKQQASYVTKTVEEDGLYLAMERLGLFE